MPDVTIFEQNHISLDEIRGLLDQLQTVDAVRQYYVDNGIAVSKRTIHRFINGKLERRFCWYPVTTITTSAQHEQENK